MIGIYKITSPSGRVYIGQSDNIEYRWQDYRYLRCKNQPRLYRSFKKYGTDRHIFEIKEICEFKNLNICERKWQEHYNVIGNKGLNCYYVKTDSKKQIVSEAVKRKISKTVKSISVIGENNFCSKKCYQYSLEGDFIKEWGCMSDIMRELGLHTSAITLCCQRKTKTGHGYQWFYEYCGEKINSVIVKGHENNIKDKILFNLLKNEIESNPQYTLKQISEKLKLPYTTVLSARDRYRDKIIYVNKSNNKK